MVKDFPTKTKRAHCWESRDAYFACLDANNLILNGLNPKSYSEMLKISPSDPYLTNIPQTYTSDPALFACATQYLKFKAECLPSWVMHFSLLRVKDMQTDAIRRKLDQDEKERNKVGSDFWERVGKK